MAGGSQIIINDQGIIITTNGKIQYQAGQHKFESGSKVKTEIPIFPMIQEIHSFTNKWDFYDLFYETNFSAVKYKLLNNKKNTYISGILDVHGRTQRINTHNNENYDILIGTDDEWTASMEDKCESEECEYYNNSHDHHNKKEKR